MIATLHLLVAVLVAICGGLLTAIVVAGSARGWDVRFPRDRAILAALALTVLGIVLGLVILATGGRPADPLHLLYAGVALVLLPIVRFWDRLAGHRSLAVGLGGLVLAGLVLRLFQTG